MRFDSQDKQLLAALDKGFIIDGETASISGPLPPVGFGAAGRACAAG